MTQILEELCKKYNLGSCYRNGIKIIKYDKKVFQWCLKSTEGGNSNGQKTLEFVIKMELDEEKEFQSVGIGMTKYEEKAFKLYLKSAEGGNNIFQWCLKSTEGGNSNGQKTLEFVIKMELDEEKEFQSVGIGMTKYEEKAFKLYLKSAEGGNNSEQFNFF
ncbi:hypothetical protein Glove_228g105 [Diversispora epigaea]|uniref:Uncharacterized protein n=1 Tax=Diversispora epigaea TaxID=1348612 RepID=A0A397IG88_9GLOM|nr:hypothetical protein Glove_228g105 [Diversispora epigaea]